MTDQNEAEKPNTITLEEYLEALKTGKELPPDTIILMPLSYFQKYEARWLAYEKRVQETFASLKKIVDGWKKPKREDQTD